MNKSIPILMYHQVSPTPPPGYQKYNVTPETFAKQMAWLDTAGYVSISLDALLDDREGKAQLRGRPIVITFDDGYQDCAKYAVPILRDHGFTAIFYLVAGLMGKPSQWLRQEKGFELALIDWPDARQLIDAGFQIGSHSVSHPRLAALSDEACHTELEQSRQLLENQLDYPVRHLAYPYGSFNARVYASAAQVGYRSACSTEIGLSTRHDSPLALHRVPVTGYDTLVDFVWRLWTAYPLREWVHGKMRTFHSRKWMTRLGWDK